MNRKLLVSALALMSMRAIIGCGAPAAPEPPSLNLPAPILNLSAERIGDSVHLAWTMPTHTTDHVPLKRPVKALVCRSIESGPCTTVGSLNLQSGAAGIYADSLPADLRERPDRRLCYQVFLQNHAGKSAGPSNAACSAAGPSPAVVTGLTAQMRRDGVLLSWTPVAGSTNAFFRIERQLLSAPAPQEAAHSPLAAPAPSVKQTLEVHPKDDSDPGHAIDNSVLSNQKYRYVVERVMPHSFSGTTVEVQSSPSEVVDVVTTDIFPPEVPRGLVAVADTVGRAIDLSWSPDTESDLAGYRVYRRDVQGGQPGQRVGSVGVQTSYRDAGVQAGHTYAYSVSAFDQSGNESKPSPEVEETLPRP